LFAAAGGSAGNSALEKAGATVFAREKGSNEMVVEFASESELVTDEAVQNISGMATQIVDLNLARTQVTDEVLKEVAKLSNLESLNLAQTQVTDAGIAYLKSMAKLKYLNLYGTKVTDECLPSIAGMKQLESVYFWQTSVTSRGADKLRGVLPKLKIVME
jgi:hypothetical protein